MKYLIIRLSSIGDIILTEPVLRLIKEKDENAHISFLTRDKFKGLLEPNPLIDEIIYYDRGKDSEFKNISNFSEKYLKQKDFDTVIDLHNNFRSFFFRKLLKKKCHVYNAQTFKRWLLVKFKTKKRILPATKRYVKTIRKLFVPGNDFNFTARFYPDTVNLKSLRKKHHITKKTYITIAPGARWFTKSWPEENFLQLIILILKKSPDEKFVIVGDKHSGNFSGIENVTDLINKLTLEELGTVISGSKLVISNDSAVAHIARGIGIDTYVIIGGTTPELGYIVPDSVLKIIENPDLNCRPCSLYGLNYCPQKHFKCMLDITPEMVYQKLKSKI